VLASERRFEQPPDDIALAWTSASFVGAAQMGDEANEYFIELTKPNRQ